jgi:hypothetical protein
MIPPRPRRTSATRGRASAWRSLEIKAASHRSATLAPYRFAKWYAPPVRFIFTVIPVNTGQMQGLIAQHTDLIGSFGLDSLR